MSRAEEGIKLRAASIAVHSGCLDLAEVLLTPLLEACRGGAGGGGGGGGGSGGGGGAGIGGGGGPSLSLASQLPVMQAVTQLHVAQVGALGRRVCDRKVLVASAGRVTSLWHEGHPTRIYRYYRIYRIYRYANYCVCRKRLSYGTLAHTPFVDVIVYSWELLVE